MIMMMLDFCGCCAAAGATGIATAASNANKPSDLFRLIFTLSFLSVGEVFQ
jgi:hypothetical protein